jgi:hypothetical protein
VLRCCLEFRVLDTGRYRVGRPLSRGAGADSVGWLDGTGQDSPLECVAAHGCSSIRLVLDVCAVVGTRYVWVSRGVRG